jgi:hypothetical protein
MLSAEPAIGAGLPGRRQVRDEANRGVLPTHPAVNTAPEKADRALNEGSGEIVASAFARNPTGRALDIGIAPVQVGHPR